MTERVRFEEQIALSEGMKFLDGGKMTLRESLQFVDRGSRSPHPGGGNNMTTILMQLGVPTVLFWEVRADLSGYEVVKLGDEPISNDYDKCGPWAKFDPRLLEEVMRKQPTDIAEILSSCRTPYQVHIKIAGAAFPNVVQSSTSFYLNERQIVEPTLETIAKSRFAGNFSKLVKPSGQIVGAKPFSGEFVEYQDGTKIHVSRLARSYLELLEAVYKSERDMSFNPAESGIMGVLPDARIMSVLDSAIYAKRADTDRVFAWSGTAMMQYMLKEPHSERWREVAAFMYDLVRKEVFPDLPARLEFVLLPTHGLGKLAVSEMDLAEKINAQISALAPPMEIKRENVIGSLLSSVQNMPRDRVTEFLLGITHNVKESAIKKLIDEGNIAAVCGIVASQVYKNWQADNKQRLDEVRGKLTAVLTTPKGGCVLDEQPTITPLEVLKGQKLFLLEGVLDCPMGDLDALRLRYQRMVLKDKVKKEEAYDDGASFSRAGYYM